MKALNTLLRSSDFDVWLSGVADQKAKARILARLASATFGNFGDCEPVGEGVSEMRIHVGPGYRAYFVRTGTTIYVLMTRGDKSSQKQDIARAKNIARELKEPKLRKRPTLPLMRPTTSITTRSSLNTFPPPSKTP